MNRIWFDQPLETVATWWRVLRRDGVTLGFTTHDRDLWLDGVVHRATPGMVPSAIRRSADFEPDSAEVEGALSHAAISSADLAAGRYDGAKVTIGLVDWETLEETAIYSGTIGAVSEEAGGFSASLASRKAELLRDPVPRTSPTCRAAFCGPGCNLAGAKFTTLDRIAAYDAARNGVQLEVAGASTAFAGGSLRWLDGALAGLGVTLIGADGGWLLVDRPLDAVPLAGECVILREGCDRRMETCSARFGNAVNFQGEPFLPGNDLLTRYPSPAQ
jgi:uncharacterized phage protein (TIGR02218 family)